MRKNTLLFLGFLLCLSSNSYGQSKIIKKNRQKLEQKFEYVLFNKDCSSAIVGKRILGVNDGGGRIPKGVKEIQIASLNTKKIEYWTPPYTRASTKTMSFSNDKFNLRLVSENGKVGLIHPCKKIVLEPKYDYIGEFNNDGTALALLDDKIDIIDLNGKNLMDTTNNPSFYDDKQDFPIPYKNTIITNNENKNTYSLFNFKTNEIVSKQTYSFIKTDLVKSDNKKIGFIAKRDGKETLVDDKGKELVPLLFENISGTINNGFFIYGDLPDNEGINIYDYENKTFIVPIEFQKDFEYGNHIGNGIWKMLFKDISPNNSPYVKQLFSVYDTLNKRFIIEPEKSNEYEKDWNQLDVINSKLISILDKEKNLRILDRTNSNEIKRFPKGTSIKYIKLKKENTERVFIVSSIQPKKNSSETFCDMYTENFEVIFENLKTYPSDIKSKVDYLYVKENINCYPCKTVYTAYDFDGNIIGEKHQFVLKK